MQKTNLEFLTKTILSCNNEETHKTVNDWLERLFSKKIIDFDSYQDLKNLNQSLLLDKYNTFIN